MIKRWLLQVFADKMFTFMKSDMTQKAVKSINCQVHERGVIDYVTVMMDHVPFKNGQTGRQTPLFYIR